MTALVMHLDQRATQRYIHLLPKDARETANSILLGIGWLPEAGGSRVARAMAFRVMEILISC